MANRWSTTLRSLATRMITAGMKALPRLSVIAVAVLAVATTAHAQRHPSCTCDASCTTHNNCLLVSDLGSNQVEQYDDYGCLCNAMFLQNGPTDPGGEGLSCSAGTANQLVTSNNGNELNVFNLTTGHYTGTQFIVPGASSIAALSVNALGTTLYAADYGANQLYSMDLNPLGSNLQTVASPYSHDVSVGYSGYIYATQFFTPPPPPGGIEQYNPISLESRISSLTNAGYLSMETTSSTVPTECQEWLGMRMDTSGSIAMPERRTRTASSNSQLAPRVSSLMAAFL